MRESNSRRRQRRSPGRSYCEHPGCTYATAPNERMCLEHKREAMDEALAGRVFAPAGKVRMPPCGVCKAPKHPNRPCANCKSAADELDEIYELDADEVFGG